MVFASVDLNILLKFMLNSYSTELTLITFRVWKRWLHSDWISRSVPPAASPQSQCGIWEHEYNPVYAQPETVSQHFTLLIYRGVAFFCVKTTGFFFLYLPGGKMFYGPDTWIGPWSPWRWATGETTSSILWEASPLSWAFLRAAWSSSLRVSQPDRAEIPSVRAVTNVFVFVWQMGCCCLRAGRGFCVWTAWRRPCRWRQTSDMKLVRAPETRRSRLFVCLSTF